MVRVFTHLNGIQYAKVFDLVVANFVNKCESLLHLVGLYAANKVQVGVVRHLVDKVSHLLTNLHPQESLVAFHLETFSSLLEALGDYLQP